MNAGFPSSIHQVEDLAVASSGGCVHASTTLGVFDMATRVGSCAPPFPVSDPLLSLGLTVSRHTIAPGDSARVNISVANGDRLFSGTSTYCSSCRPHCRGHWGARRVTRSPSWEAPSCPRSAAPPRHRRRHFRRSLATWPSGAVPRRQLPAFTLSSGQRVFPRASTSGSSLRLLRARSRTGTSDRLTSAHTAATASSLCPEPAWRQNLGLVRPGRPFRSSSFSRLSIAADRRGRGGCPGAGATAPRRFAHAEARPPLATPADASCLV